MQRILCLKCFLIYCLLKYILSIYFTSLSLQNWLIVGLLTAIFGGLGEIGANDLLRLPDRINVRVFIGAMFVDVDLPNVIHSPSMPFK